MHGRTSRIALITAAALLGAVAARAEPLPDPSTIITGQVENDSLSGTDRNYTSGIRLGITLPTGQLPGFASDFGHWVWGGGQQRLAFDLTQNMFTPRVTQAAQPDPRDRPYAAILLGIASLIQDTDTMRNVVSLGLGAIGPPALGEEAQNMVHRNIHALTAKGWSAQLSGQPVVQLTADRIWRLPITQPGSALEVDVLPELTAGLGTWRTYVQAGAQFRIGQGLDSDFGAARIRPGMSGGDAFNATRPLAWYFFVGADGQAVAWDETLSGEPFASTRHVSARPLVAELQAGLVVMVSNTVRASFTQVWQTHEFYGQYGHMFRFSSAALSVKF
jgi:lipid A 3-O-deacylase